MYIYVPYVCLVPMEAKRGHWVSRTKIQIVISKHRVLGTEPESSAKATNH